MADSPFPFTRLQFSDWFTAQPPDRLLVGGDGCIERYGPFAQYIREVVYRQCLDVRVGIYYTRINQKWAYSLRWDTPKWISRITDNIEEYAFGWLDGRRRKYILTRDVSGWSEDRLVMLFIEPAITFGDYLKDFSLAMRGCEIEENHARFLARWPT